MVDFQAIDGIILLLIKSYVIWNDEHKNEFVANKILITDHYRDWRVSRMQLERNETKLMQ